MKQFALLGYPLGHSFSRRYFTQKFQEEGIDAEYLNFELPSMDLYLNTLEAHPELRGHNVTIPYKQQVMSFLDELSDEARAIGAVNVVKVTRREDGSRYLKGFNSDVIGFVESIRPLLKPHHRKALVLGTGGASKAVVYGLREKLGMEVKLVSRSQREGMFTYDDINGDVIREYEVIVNCTPCGMYPKVDECPNLPYQEMTENNLLYDLVYNPEMTQFMLKGQQQGAVVKGGSEMLILQAEASWDFWTN